MISTYRYKLCTYFSLTFMVTFTLWFAGAYVSFQDDRNGLYLLLMLPGLMAPFIISLVMIFRSHRSDLKKEYVNRLFNLRLIRWNTLPAFIFIMPLSVLLSIVISLQFGESISQFQFADGFSFSCRSLPVLLLLVMAAGFEELGWRGYAFDSLQSRYNFLTAAIVFGLLWSLWHFPLIFVKDSYQYAIFHENIWFAINFFVSIIPMGIIISWICMKNRKSVLAAIVFHFIINISSEMLNISQITKCIETIILTLIGAALVMLEKEMFFSKAHLVSEAN